MHLYYDELEAIGDPWLTLQDCCTFAFCLLVHVSTEGAFYHALIHRILIAVGWLDEPVLCHCVQFFSWLYQMQQKCIAPLHYHIELQIWCYNCTYVKSSSSQRKQHRSHDTALHTLTRALHTRRRT
eukprot:20667-Heterococcus_DN1.PRE.3